MGNDEFKELIKRETPEVQFDSKEIINKCKIKSEEMNRINIARRKKIIFISSFFLVAILSIMLILGLNNNNTSDNAIIVKNESVKQYFFDKFEISFDSLFQSDLDGRNSRTSFLEFANDWYRIQPQPVDEYYAIYLDNRVYDVMINQLLSDNCIYRSIVDGKCYVRIANQEIEVVKRSKIDHVDGSVAAIYSYLISGAKFFCLNDTYYSLEEYLALLNKDIPLGKSNLLFLKSSDINDLSFRHSDGYTAIAFFYHQNIDYFYDYGKQCDLIKTESFYGTMVAYQNSNDNIYYNKLDVNKKYLLMNIPLEVNRGCVIFEKLKYNISGKKEFIAFEILEKDNKEWICIKDNSDIRTITFNALGDNFEVLFKNKQNIAGKEYYNVDELLSVSEIIRANRDEASSFNYKASWASIQDIRNIVPTFIDDCVKVNTQYSSPQNEDEYSRIKSGDAIFETDISPLVVEYQKAINPTIIRILTSIPFDQFKVQLFITNDHTDTDPNQSLDVSWVKDGEKYKLVMNYDEYMVGRKIIIYAGQNATYHYQYTSYYGAIIESDIHSSYNKAIYIILE